MEWYGKGLERAGICEVDWRRRRWQQQRFNVNKTRRLLPVTHTIDRPLSLAYLYTACVCTRSGRAHTHLRSNSAVPYPSACLSLFSLNFMLPAPLPTCLHLNPLSLSPSLTLKEKEQPFESVVLNPFHLQQMSLPNIFICAFWIWIL